MMIRRGISLIVLAVGLAGCKAGDPPNPTPKKAAAAPTAAPVPNVPPGAVLVNVNMVGFDPEVIEAKAGERVQLAFFRPNAANCAREVIFPDLGVKKDLPPGETTLVEVTPKKTGAFVFQCGMEMLKGKLIVR